jgi:hypothetical protein
MQKSMFSLAFYLFLIRICSPLSAQEPIGVGEWRDHLPYNRSIDVAIAKDRVYCATPSGLFYFDKKEHNIAKISKIQGLSEIDVSAIAWSHETDILMIAYQDGNLDLLKNKSISNFPQIKNKLTLSGKQINNIMLIGSDAYLSCNFGIVVFNLEKKEFRDTYFIGPDGSQLAVSDMCFDGRYLYAATPSGIYKADSQNPNLINYTNWNKINTLPEPNAAYSGLAWFDGRLYVIKKNSGATPDQIFYADNDTWMPFDPASETKYMSVAALYDHLIVADRNLVKVYNTSGEIINQIWSGDPRQALIDTENTIWVADHTNGLSRKPMGDSREYLYPDGPESDRSFQITTSNSRTYVAAGGFNTTLSNNYSKPCYYEFSDDDGWSSVCLGEDSARDITNIIIDPANPDHLFAATWGYGLFEFLNNKPVAHFNSSNSPMQSVLEGNYVRLMGLAYDEEKNLWMTSSGVENNILVLKNDRQWKAFNYGRLTGNSSITQLLITSWGDKWAVLPRGGGLLAFNNNQTIDNEADDKKKVFAITDAEGVTITNQVYCLAEDLDGNIWVGTNDGPVVYYSPQRVFEGGVFEANKILVPKNDTSIYGEYLLKNQIVSSIMVDGANRKWIGTQGVGLFLMSPDGKKELARFTTDNSPLISNNILDLSIDQHSGEVFIATDKGVVSYRGTATKGNEEFTNVYVFPNPVRENYEGDITITGLITDANVKITDISGNLVFETTSLGGQAVWNGRNFKGKRVKTGVYLIFCSNEDGTKTFITKLLFIN